MQRLLEGSAPVTALFAGNPFPDSPPRQLRALLYDYRFTDSGQRDGNAWWSRRQEGVFYPSVTLDNFRSR
jgi:lipase maturation factor 1